MRLRLMTTYSSTETFLGGFLRGLRKKPIFAAASRNIFAGVNELLAHTHQLIKIIHPNPLIINRDDLSK